MGGAWQTRGAGIPLRMLLGGRGAMRPACPRAAPCQGSNPLLKWFLSKAHVVGCGEGQPGGGGC